MDNKKILCFSKVRNKIEVWFLYVLLSGIRCYSSFMNVKLGVCKMMTWQKEQKMLLRRLQIMKYWNEGFSVQIKRNIQQRLQRGSR